MFGICLASVDALSRVILYSGTWGLFSINKCSIKINCVHTEEERLDFYFNSLLINVLLGWKEYQNIGKNVHLSFSRFPG